MMTRCDCARAETIAGAISLGEADDAQRDAYRSHLATCERCRADLGGEREIERVMATVGGAREAERWEPDLRAVRIRPREKYGAWRWVAALAAAVALIAGLRMIERHPSTTVVVQSGSATERAAARAVAALNTQTMPRREHEAESLAFAPAASGTMELKLRLDGRGASSRCVVIKSSGSRTLDEAVCRAALRTISTRR